LSQLEIISAIDFTHPAFAKQANYSIAISENGSRHKSRIVD
jgi:hypothetical protein